MLLRMKKGPKTLSAREVFARNLRRARRLKDLSQEDVALEAGLNRAYVSSVERGERNISIDSMEKLAQALRLELKVLVDPTMFKDLEDAGE
jgi:transcriptional regulator with XRE-family HTH domain